MKICLDAGHERGDNPSPANPTYCEGTRMFDLQGYLKPALERYGFEVVCTRHAVTDNPSLYERGTAAAGCALLLSLHSNAAGNERNDSVDYVRVYYPVSRREEALAQLLSETIAATMGTRQSAQITVRWNSAHNADYYGVIRHSVAVGVTGMILEHSFHTNAQMTAWLLSDENLKRLAEAEAAALAGYYGMTKKEEPAPEQKEPENRASEESELRYETLGDVSEKDYRPTVEKLIRLGVLRGKGGSGGETQLDLGEDALRILVMLDRAGLFDIEKME